MSVSLSTLRIEGSLLLGENPLPQFRNRQQDREVGDNGTLTPDLKENLGKQAGERYLPYRMQDRYTRERKPLVLKTIVLENEHLKAVFLPEYGGRLYSLTEKKTQRELLYTNPVLQPANLAILNGWFSGGIEWNIGQLGHAFTTMSSVHMAKLLDSDGNEFIRLYDYERCKNVFWHVDFHLPAGADKLAFYMRAVNDNDETVPMYWWTNIAVKETEQARVFSGTDEVIYIDFGVKGFGRGKLPNLPTVPGADSSYPLSIPFSNEYFFLTPDGCKAPWEAVAYEDGSMFYDRSTSKLQYRKMFCWGNHPGGRRWCDFLARPGEGNYIEIQGGLTPTQLHGIDMPGNTVWDFTQVVGMTDVNAEQANQQDWLASKEYIEGCVEQQIGETEIYRMHEQYQQLALLDKMELLHRGSGWGALEQLRREQMEYRSIPSGFVFDGAGMEDAQMPWLTLLQEGSMPISDVQDIPPSWMIQEQWQQLLEQSLQHKQGQTWNAYMHYGVMLYEAGEEDRALEAWMQSLALQPSAWVYRNIAAAMRQRGELDQALHYLEKAYQMLGGFPDRAFAEEYISLLIHNKQYEQAWQAYESLPASFKQSDRLQIIVGAAALELGNESYLQMLFHTEFAVIREGEVTIVELWYAYNAQKLAKQRNVQVTDELLKEAAAAYPPPSNIDFRIIAQPNN